MEYRKIQKISIGLVLAIFLISIFLPLVTYAIEDYTVLAPLPGTTACEDRTGYSGCTTNLQTYLPGLFKFGIGIAAVLAFVMITYGGIMYMTSDAISGKSEGKDKVTNAIWGLILVIGAWVILNTINPKILKFDFSIPKPEITAPETATVTAGTITTCCTNIPGTNILQGYKMSPAQIQSDTQIRQQLKDGNVMVNNTSPCINGQTLGCTNVNDLPPNAINGLKNLKANCGILCIVTVTGGTEGGHAEHGPGKSAVDISPNSSLNNYLATKNPAAKTPISGTTVTIGGATYKYENTGDNGRATAPHWHVVF